MTRHRTLALAAVAAVVLLTAACGSGTDEPAVAADRTIEIDMVDTAFRPDDISLRKGETVRFVFRNEGKLAHDAFLGDREAQDDHEREMRDAEEGDGHGHGEDDDDAITVKPGKTGELVHTFDAAGTLEIGCHQLGHYEAGMTIQIAVT